jgi:pyruvate dehydrogenase E2 component (dihydrolipoamide acetyltransferase)
MEVRAEQLIETRTQLKNLGHKISVNDFVVRACALALREHPEVNSGFNSADQTLIRFKTIDISVAVAMPGGLITPIVRHADYKNLGEISVEIKHLAQKAKEGKLQREEYVGGSFTVSNLGMYGVSDFVGIINPPQAALLAIGAIEDRAVVEDHHVVPGKIMRLTLSGDHRVIDGAVGAQFLQTVKKYLENPASLIVM